ncbi:Protein of unknown function [Gryllus bimaculatus]|nr:Protein of unknown function [Gryllus bimaculatus]
MVMHYRPRVALKKYVIVYFLLEKSLKHIDHKPERDFDDLKCSTKRILMYQNGYTIEDGKEMIH